mgnify:CR=1 FL=1
MVNWLLHEDDLSDFDQLALGVLDHLLMGTTTAPLYQAMLSSGLGTNVMGGGLSDELKQATFSIGLKGVSKDDVPKVEELATSTGTMFGARKIDGANADASGLSSSPSWRCATRDSRSTRRVAVFRPALAREVFPRGMAADGRRARDARTRPVRASDLARRSRERPRGLARASTSRARPRVARRPRPSARNLTRALSLFPPPAGTTRARSRASCTTRTSTHGARPRRRRCMAWITCSVPCPPSTWCVSRPA